MGATAPVVILASLSGHAAGKTDPEKLASLATGRAEPRREAPAEPLRGRARTSARVLRMYLGLMAAVDQAVEQIDTSLGKALEPLRTKETLLATITGGERVDRTHHPGRDRR